MENQLCFFDQQEYAEVVPIPRGYVPSERMPDMTYEEWRQRIKSASINWELRPDLANKLLNSLSRMPILNGQEVFVSYSGGKDSGLIGIQARMRYPVDRISALFADTEDEWPETYTQIDEYEKWLGIKVHRLKSCGIHTLLRERIPVWPRPGRRHCTKALKLEPQRDWLDEHGYA